MYVNGYNATYFDSFGVECIPKGIKKFMDNKNMANIFRILAYGSMCGHFGVGFIDLMLNNERLADSLNNF